MSKSIRVRPLPDRFEIPHKAVGETYHVENLTITRFSGGVAVETRTYRDRDEVTRAAVRLLNRQTW